MQKRFALIICQTPALGGPLAFTAIPAPTALGLSFAAEIKSDAKCQCTCKLEINAKLSASLKRGP